MNRIVATLKNIVTRPNLIKAARLLAAATLVTVLVIAAIFAAGVSNSLLAAAALVGMLVGIFGSMYILYPEWYTDDTLSI